MKKFLSMVMALAMTLTLVTVGASAKDFTDNSKITYGEAVDVISGLGVVDGYTDGSFNPTATLTRGAAAKIICNLLLGPTTASALGVTSAPFTDVPVSNVFAGYIAYCSSQGIINGYGDGSFKPAATVTGYQFMKMLLGALGYDGTIEGFTGTNWTVNVAKLAISIGLDDGNSSFVGSKAMTREEAALYAFNTLKATMVEYANKGTTITVNGATITSAASKATAVENKTSDYRTSVTSATYSASGTMQFCEQYFKKLTLNDSAATIDSFGRPAHVWKNDTTKIGTYADDAVLTYTAGVKGKVLYDDIKDAGYTIPSTIPVVRNGGDANDYSTTGLSTSTEVLGGNGTVLEVYANSSDVVSKIVVVATYLGKVTTITKDNTSTKATDERALTISVYGLKDTPTTITANPDDTANFDAIYASAVANKTYVLVTPKGDNTSSTLGLTLAAPTVVTGLVSKVVTGDSAAVTIGGTAYSLADTQTVVDTMAVSTTQNQTVYLDSYGYAIYATNTASDATDNSLYVVYAYTGSSDWSTSVPMIQAVMPDGTVKLLQYTCAAGLTEDGVNALSSTNPVAAGTAYQYTEDDGVYTLTAASGGYYGSTATYNKGAVAIANNTTIKSTTKYIALDNTGLTNAASKNYYFASNVNYVYISGTKSDLKVSVKTGLQAATIADSNDFAVITKDSNDNYVISTVFVNGAATSDNTDIIYVATGFASDNYTSTQTGNDGKTTLYGYTAYLDGAKITVYTAGTSNKSAGFYTYTVDDSTGAYVLTTTSTNCATNSSATVTYVNDTYYLNGTFSPNTDAVGDYDASGAVVKDIDSDRDIDSVSALKDAGTTSIAVVYNSTDKVVTAIYVLPNA